MTSRPAKRSLRLVLLSLAVFSCRSAPRRPPNAQAKPATTSPRRATDGHCEPEPRAGTPCDEARESWCVLDWGTPGGGSTTLWCRDGRWHVDEEKNLD